MTYSSNTLQNIKIEANNDLEMLNDWTKKWLEDFNPKKTKALIISNNVNLDINLSFNGGKVKNHKHLGVTLSADGN